MTIPDAAVWAVCEGVTLGHGEKCRKCSAQEVTPYATWQKPCRSKAEDAITTVQRALAGCGANGGIENEPHEKG
jgi:hypothetical protein